MSRSPLRLPALGRDPDGPFPPADSALREPDGLLAVGECTVVQRFTRRERNVFVAVEVSLESRAREPGKSGRVRRVYCLKEK